jgi:hypothetical protein
MVFSKYEALVDFRSLYRVVYLIHLTQPVDAHFIGVVFSVEEIILIHSNLQLSFFNLHKLLFVRKKFENTKEVIRRRISKKDRNCSKQKKMEDN